MNSNKRRKAIYRSILAVLLGGTVVMASGCSNNTEEPTKGREETTEDNKAVKSETASSYQTPSEVMTLEESSSLTAGQFISAKDLTKIPDAAALENMNLSFVYVYTYLPEAKDSIYNEYMYWRTIEEDLIAYEIATEENVDKYASDYQFKGIRILPIVDYTQSSDSTWLKLGEFEGNPVDVGPVITEEKIKELNEKQETQQ